MREDIRMLNDQAAIEALDMVSKMWIQERGLEFYETYYGVQNRSGSNFQDLPSWVNGMPEVTPSSGEQARFLLDVLVDSRDAEVSAWTEDALRSVSQAQAQFDPVIMAIGGAILIGAILAARVKRIGSVEFYEGIDENLAPVLKAGVAVLGL